MHIAKIYDVSDPLSYPHQVVNDAVQEHPALWGINRHSIGAMPGSPGTLSRAALRYGVSKVSQQIERARRQNDEDALFDKETDA